MHVLRTLFRCFPGPIFHELFYSFKALLLGSPYGLFMVIFLSWYKERVEPIALIGVGCIFMSMCLPKIYAAVEPGGGPFTLLLFRGLIMMPGSFLLLCLREVSLARNQLKPGLFILSAYMSLNGLLLGAFIILALPVIDGAVAFHEVEGCRRAAPDNRRPRCGELGND